MSFPDSATRKSPAAIKTLHFQAVRFQTESYNGKEKVKKIGSVGNFSLPERIKRYFQKDLGKVLGAGFFMSPRLENLVGLALPARRPHPPASRAASQVLAGVLDLLASSSGDLALSQSLETSSRDFRQAFQSLSPSQQNSLRHQWGERTLEEILCLSQERDPAFLEAGLLSIAQRIRDRGETGLAAGFLQAILQVPQAHPQLRAFFSAAFLGRARAELGAMQGHGAIGPHLAFLAEHLVDEVSDPVTLAGFAVGSGVFQLTRFAALSRLTSSGLANFLTRGVGAEFLSGVAGVSMEASAMTFSTQGFSWALGRPVSWDLEQLGSRALGLGMTLGLLRGGSVLAERGFNWVHGVNSVSLQATRLTGFTGISQRLFPQVAMFGAIGLGHGLEARLGLRQPSDPGMWLTESLVTLLQFNLGGNLFERLQSRPFARWTQTLQWHAEQMARPSLPAPLFPDLAWGPALLPAGASWLGSPRPAGRTPFRVGEENISLMVKKDGEEGDSSFGSPIPSEAPHPVSAIVVRDLPFKSLLDQAPLPILVTGTEGELIFANSLARSVFLRVPSDLLHGRLEQVIEPVPGEEGSVRSLTPGKEGQVWEMQTQPLPDPEPGLVHYFMDRTQQRAQRQEILLLEEQLGALAGDRELMQGILHDSANTLSDLFLKESAMESILTRMQPRETPSGGFKGIVTRIRDFGTSLNRVVRMFQTTRKVVMGRGEMTALELEPLVMEALSLNEAARDRLRIQLKTDLQNTTIWGEETTLMHSLLNLFVNASHAMPNGGQLTVRLRSESEQAVIEVLDTGHGIASDHLEKIFQPHFSTKGPFGTGMGLFMVRRTVEEIHKGRIEVETEMGKGTTFRIFLPLPVFSSSSRR